MKKEESIIVTNVFCDMCGCQIHKSDLGIDFPEVMLRAGYLGVDICEGCSGTLVDKALKALKSKGKNK